MVAAVYLTSEEISFILRLLEGEQKIMARLGLQQALDHMITKLKKAQKQKRRRTEIYID